MLADIDSDTRLESLEFMDWGVSITSVRVTLSNGKSSPPFHREGCSSNLLKNPQTITFDERFPISAVSAYDNQHTWNNVRAIRFLDSEGETVYQYNPKNQDLLDSVTYHLEEGEELIGVYGLKEEK